MTGETWSHPRRIAFRLGVVFAALTIVPWPLDALPGTSWLTGPYGDAWDWLTRAFADVIGVIVPPTQPTGSGDTMAAYVGLLLEVVLSVIGAAIWTALDRKRAAYPRVQRVTYTALRYWLGCTMLSYGFAKVFKTQFPATSLAGLDVQVGEQSPMGLLWRFMGYSTPYTVFAGLAECVGGSLLFWRRTTTLGALVTIGVLINVVMLNFCYDVPVKLFSSTLLAVAIVLVLPDARRLVSVVIGHAAGSRPLLPRWSRRGEWIRRIVKVLFLAWVYVHTVLEQRDALVMIEGSRSPLRGVYDVVAFAVDGVERPPLTTDATRWHRLVLDRGALVRTMTGEAVRYRADVDVDKHGLTLTGADAPLVFVYRQPAPDRLELDGGTPHLHIVLRRRSDDYPLLARGFHWIQEFPYNR